VVNVISQKGRSAAHINNAIVFGRWHQCALHPTHASLDHASPQPKRHLDRFSDFARLTIVTDRRTDRPRYSVCNNRPHLRT